LDVPNSFPLVLNPSNISLAVDPSPKQNQTGSPRPWFKRSIVLPSNLSAHKRREEKWKKWKPKVKEVDTENWE